MTTTFGVFWRSLAALLDDVEEYAVTAVASPVVTVPALVNGATEPSDTTYNDRWMYVGAGFAQGTQSRARGDSYDPAAGTLRPIGSWDTTPHVGDTLCLTSLFPVVSQAYAPSAQTGYNGIMTQAARLLLAPDLIDVTTVASQQAYSLAAQARWLDRPERARVVYDPARASGWPRRPTSRRWELRWDGGTPSLVFTDRAYPTSGATFQVGVVRPGDSLVNGAESADGAIRAETDAVLPALGDLVTVGLWVAYRILTHRSYGRPSGDWAGLAEAQEARVMKLATLDQTLFRTVAAAAPAARQSSPQEATSGAA